MEFISEYISVIALVAALCVGYILKNLVPNEEVNKFIPLIAAVAAGSLRPRRSLWVSFRVSPRLVCTRRSSSSSVSFR